MEQLILRILRKLYPALAAGTVYPRWGIITRTGTVADGVLADANEPAFSVSVQMLDEQHQPLGPVYESVPLPVGMAGNSRGMFGFPQTGTWVLVQFVQGSPSQPVITGVYPTGRHLPAVGEGETLIQHSSAVYLRSTSTEGWDMRSRNKIRVGNADVDIVEQLATLAEILKNHDHQNKIKPTQSAQIGEVSDKVGSLKM